MTTVSTTDVENVEKSKREQWEFTEKSCEINFKNIKRRLI